MAAVSSDPEICLPHFPDGFLLAPPDIPDEQWHELRADGIGGSDIAALLGLNPHKGPLKLYMEKKGRYKQPPDAALERAARRGKRLESLVAEFLAEETGHLVLPTPGTVAHKKEPWIRVNLDGVLYDPDPCVTEYKTRTWLSGRAENWAGDTPPDGPTVQACWGLIATGWKRAYVAGLVDNDFYPFVIERDQELLDHILTVVRRFYYEHLLPGIPPPPDGLDSTAEMLAHLWDVKPGSVKIFDPLEVQHLRTRSRQLKDEIKAKKEELNKTHAAMKLMLGDAEIAIAPDGRELFSWKANGNFVESRFTEELPATAAEYTTTKNVIDLARIKANEPNLYAAYRARVFRDGSTS